MPTDRAAWRKWYSTARWRAIRQAQLSAEPICFMCQDDGLIVSATVCDHIEPHRGNERLFWDGPFQSLCKHHHDTEKQRQERGSLAQPYNAIPDETGWPIDARHPANRP